MVRYPSHTLGGAPRLFAGDMQELQTSIGPE